MSEAPRTPQHRISRGKALVKLGGFAAAAFGAAGVGARELVEVEQAEGAGTGLAALESGLVSCVLAPEMTGGPYYLEGDKVRRDITEGKAGVPLALRLTVLNVSTCKPIRNAAVDIWHCDAGGTYSGVQGDTGTFMRGIQRTDENGLANFRTIYPGWYSGRTVHIHLKVYLGGRTVHTGQLFFPDSLTDVVYRRSPYSQRPDRDARNASDSIYRNGGKRSQLKLKKNGTGYIGSMTMGVQRS